MMEGAVNETSMAYLMGPVVMILLGIGLWVAAHYARNERRRPSNRWLDTHYVDLMHHRH
jgi:hypothetical protein